ncbi:penicillin-binding protein [Ornithinimicrobium faecis]|uniref:Penicillin-binding protein n=1 Tax=Ornithinimicrobium faecis TaxID=2934158 RepID=A0ABY4YTH8_9MICO|nr:transglycosylase domain-containing protein [Ornithinimicrobium sp. HY1793]USQ80071.1 penicillin-binding protein [Ornithinimicrobium sp. HY1793]
MAKGPQRSARGRNAQRSRGRRRRPIWKRVLGWLFGLGVLALVLGAVAVAILYARTDIPQPNEFATSESSILYYADGETELARFTGGYDRESVPLTEVPDHVQKAMLAAEDRSFYENQGVSITGTGRALWRTLTTDDVQGGSTITQQYVKNYFLTQDRTVTRKVNEVLIAVKIDRELSKDEILENYFNTIYFGRGAYGIQTAAQAYFGKDVSDLSVAEGAFLAGVTNAPSLFDPAYQEGNRERAEARVDYIINGMVEEGWLSAQDAASVTFPDIQDPEGTTATTGTEGYIATQVRAELVNELGIAEADIDRSGLRIVTTIDQQHQEAAESAVNDNLPQEPDDLQVGLVATRPGDGAITAMYGGADYSQQQLNTATDAHLQAGSLFKVFTLIAAVQDGISTESVFPGPSPMEFTIEGQSEPYEVNNFRDAQFGPIDLRQATANSVNTVYVQLNEEIGPERTREVAEQLGLPEDTPGLDSALSNVLGPAAPTVLEMSSAFSVIAAQGVAADPYLVTSVTSDNGVFDFERDPVTDEVIDPDVTADVTEAMTHVITEGSGTAAGDLGRPAAGKSGTSEDNKSAWFNGFVPQLTGTVGLYEGDGTVSMQDIGDYDQVTGGTYPALIWGDFMRGALEGEPVEEFPERVGVGDELEETAPPTTEDEEDTTTETEEPTTEEPTTEDPTTEEPTTEDPTTEEPTETEDPTTEPTPTGPPTEPEPPTPTQPTDPPQPTGPPTGTTPPQPTGPTNPGQGPPTDGPPGQRPPGEGGPGGPGESGGPGEAGGPSATG